MQYEYVKNRVADAIYELCTGPGDVRRRLLSAHGEISALLDNQFPNELLGLWHEIHAMLTKHGPAFDFEGDIWKGSVANTLDKIRNSTGVKIAEKLYQLHKNLQSNYEPLPSRVRLAHFVCYSLKNL